MFRYISLDLDCSSDPNEITRSEAQIKKQKKIYHKKVELLLYIVV